MPDPAPSTPTPAATTQASAETTTTGGVTATMSTTSSTVKPGWKTTEFWLSLVAKVLTILFLTNAIPVGGTAERIAGAAAAALISLGYQVTRSMTKSAASNALATGAMLGSVANDNATAKANA